MYKATNAQVKQLQQWGQEDKVVKYLIDTDAQPNISYTAYFAPSQANWSWQIGIASIDGNTYELLTRFGSVEGGRQLYMPEHNTNGEYNILDSEV